MMRNNSETTYTSENIRTPKAALALCTAFGAAVDAMIVVILAVGGFEPVYFIAPCFLLAFDLLYFAVSLLITNFRFRYSIGVWLSYVVFAATACGAGTAILLGGAGVVITNAALGLWAGVHLFAVVCAVVTALYASRKMNNRVVAVLLALLFAAASAFYAAFLLARGFFGQGVVRRTLVYDYQEESDSYTVSGVLYGTGDWVEIEDTFNGKPVTAVSCTVLANPTVKKIVFNGEFSLVDRDELSFGSTAGKSVLVREDAAQTMRAQLYECASDLSTRSNALALANATVPFGLEENQTYVAFTYDEEAYAACDGEVLPLYISTKGAQVPMSDFASTYEYVAHNDATDVADLDWGYRFGNRYLLSDIVADGRSLFDGYVLNDGVCAEVRFEKIYRVYVGSGNDEKYDVNAEQSDFCYDTLNGARLDYRYVAADGAEGFLGGISPREGFGLSWLFEAHGSSSLYSFDSLSAAIGSLNSSEIDVFPVWSLNAPKVAITSSDADLSIVYGEDISFTAEAVSPADGITLVYEWRHGDAEVGAQRVLSLAHPSLSLAQDGAYDVTVTTVGGEVTSLVSSATASVSLAIAKKTVSFGWDLPDENDRIYDGTAKRVFATFDSSQLVGGDRLTYTLSVNSYATALTYADCTDAGDYFFAVALDADSSIDYATDATAYGSLTVARRPVAVVWSEYDFTYNGLTQTPSASAKGIDGGELVAAVGGGRIRAGSYTATASTTDTNYILTGETFDYTIKKAPLTVTAADCTAVYGNTPQPNGATYSGLVNGESSSVLGGTLVYVFTNPSKDVGLYPSCVTIGGLTSSDYDVAYVFGDLRITERAVTLAWSGYAGLVYNATAKNVTATVSNKVSGDDVQVTVENGDAVAAGSYTASAVGLFGASAGNYVIASSLTCPYTIAQAAVTFRANDVAVIYGDGEGVLTASVTGAVYNDEITYRLSRESGSAAGAYAVTVGAEENLSGALSNYSVTCIGAVYTVLRRTATVTWSGYENLVYDGTQQSVAAALGNTVAGDDVYAVVTGGDATDAGNYTATAALGGTDADNYTLTAANSLDYTIEKAPLTALAVSLADYVYGTVGTPVLSGNAGGGAVTYTYGATADISASGAASGLDVGEYFVFASVAETSNYLAGTASATFSVVPCIVELAWSGYENLVYDAQAKNVTAAVVNAVSGDDVAVAVTNGNKTEAGSYVAQAALTGADAKNYALPAAYTCAYEIAQAELTITANDATSVYGESVATLTARVDGVIYNKEVTYTLRVETSAFNAGDYAIRVIVGTYNNYDITTVDGVYTVTKATLVLVGFSAENLFTLADPVAYGTTLAEISPLLPAQTIVGSWVWKDGEHTTVGDIGQKSFVVTYASADANYNDAVASVTLTVKHANEFSVNFVYKGVMTDGSLGLVVELEGAEVRVVYSVAGEWGDGAKGTVSVTVTLNGSAVSGAVQPEQTLVFSQAGVYVITFTCSGDDRYLSNSVTYSITVTEKSEESAE